MMKKETTKRFGLKTAIMIAAGVLLGSQVMLSSGCALLLIGGAAGAGIAGTAYYMGELQGEVDAKPAEIKEASTKALEKLKLKLISATGDELSTKITARTAQDDEVKILAKLQKDGKSKVYIRVGSFGDRTMSENIFSEIKKVLPEVQKEAKKK
ncbi:MAG: DUF3568 family protein [Lentisphaerae bacterium]|nr:DUF3568 family protein [Lentisphaerota bacterium]MCP4100047.1 DUF3568 family protein [Lentisphaerota bacterium]